MRAGNENGRPAERRRREAHSVCALGAVRGDRFGRLLVRGERGGARASLG